MNYEDECDSLLPDIQETFPVTRQPLGVNKEYGACNQPVCDITIAATTESSINRPRSFSSSSAPAGLNTIALPSPVASVISPVVISVDETDIIAQNDVTASSPLLSAPSPGVTGLEEDRIEPEGSSDISEEDILKLVGLVEQCVGKFFQLLF